MVKETHTKGGYLLALLALPFIDNEYLSSYEPVYKFILLFIYMYFSYIGSIIPDIDMRGSCASKTLLKYADNNIVFISSFSGLIIGCFSHMILDLFTKEGIELLYPIDINFSLMPIKTNSKTEKLICKVLSFIVIFLLGYRFYILI